MVDIISKRDGPRDEDVRARKMIHENRATITRLADQFSQGSYSASKTKATAPEPELSGTLYHHVGVQVPRSTAPTEVYVRISINNRVVAVDASSGRQVHFLGEIRCLDGQRYFALAVTENRFISNVTPEVMDAIGELDGQIIDSDCPESLLADEISRRLGYT